MKPNLINDAHNLEVVLLYCFISPRSGTRGWLDNVGAEASSARVHHVRRPLFGRGGRAREPGLERGRGSGPRGAADAAGSAYPARGPAGSEMSVIVNSPLRRGSWPGVGGADGRTEAATDDEGCAVRVPSKSGMVDGARETYRGTLRVTMFDKGREVVSATTRHACLETGGEFDAEWVATSAMTEPLKSVAYNVDLERAISSRLDEARRRGVIDVPGL